MKNINEFLHGSDYTKKHSDFQTRVADLERNYQGKFKTEQPYFSLINLPENRVELKFDENKEIPADLRNEVEAVFKEVWR